MKTELILIVTNEVPSGSRDTSAAGVPPFRCTYRQIPVRACEVASRYSRMVRGLAESFLDGSRVLCGGGPQ